MALLSCGRIVSGLVDQHRLSTLQMFCFDKAGRAEARAAEVAAEAAVEAQRRVDQAVAAANALFEEESEARVREAVEAARHEMVIAQGEVTRLSVAGAVREAEEKALKVAEAAAVEQEAAIAEAVAAAVTTAVDNTRRECEDQARAAWGRGRNRPGE